MQAILNIAIRAARKAGGSILRKRLRLDAKLTPKTVADLQAAQQQAEAEMADIILKAYPEHGIVASSSVAAAAATVWHLEVVNGIENLLRNIPHYALVMVIKEQQKSTYALIYDPHTEEIFTAAAGAGARCNDYRLRVNSYNHLQDTVLAASMSPAVRYDQAGLFATLATQGVTLHYQQCAALSLAYVAAGRVDGFYGDKLSHTVTDAAALLINEAGGLVGDLQGGHHYQQRGELIAASPKLFKALLPLLEKHFSD